MNNIPFNIRPRIPNPALGYQEELERRREQERRDEAMARRMQALGLEDPDDEEGFGNAAGHFMNENFVQRAHDILSAVYNPAQQHAADRLVAEHRANGHTGNQQLPAGSREFGRRASERVVPRRGGRGELCN